MFSSWINLEISVFIWRKNHIKYDMLLIQYLGGILGFYKYRKLKYAYPIVYLYF